MPDLPDWDKKQRLAFEREMLGLYVSDHPLSGLEHVLAAAADVSIATLLPDEARPDGSTVVVAGLITSLQRKMSKQGNPWAAVTIEDMEGSVEIMFFGETYLAYSTALAEDAVVVIRGPGAAPRRDDAAAGHGGVAAGRRRRRRTRRWSSRWRSSRCTPPVVERLREVLSTHPGRHRGAPAAHQPGPRDRHAARRRPAGRAVAVAVRRPQGAARPELPGVLTSHASTSAAWRSGGNTG